MNKSLLAWIARVFFSEFSSCSSAMLRCGVRCRLFFSLFPRMELPVFLLYKFLVDVRVDLRGADVRVPEEFLQHAQVHSRFQAVRGETVPEGVR